MESEIDLQAIKQAAKQELGKISGVVGVGIGNNQLIIYVDSIDTMKKVPSSFQGIPIQIVVTGVIEALT